MTDKNLPARGSFSLPAAAPDGPSELAYAVSPAENESINWGRMFHALRRYRWLVLAATVLGTSAGVVATRFVSAEYKVESKLWIEMMSRRNGPDLARGPFRSAQLFEPEGWVDLLKSYQVLDVVVRDLNLYLEVKAPTDSTVMKTFRLREEYVPGEYVLEVGKDGKAWTLSAHKMGQVDKGTVGDSVGRRLGFAWAPPKGSITPGRKVEFRVDTPRDAASRLSRRLDVHADPDGNFLTIELAGTNPRRITEIVNAVVKRYIDLASDLKKEKLVQLTAILGDQLRTQQQKLQNAENAYERLRRQTITLPSDHGPGADTRADPVMSRYFELQVERDQVHRDKETLQRLLATRDTAAALGSMASVGSIAQMSPDLSETLKELTAKEADLRSLQRKFNDEHPQVQRAISDIATIKQQTIPALGTALIRDLNTRESELDQRLATQTGTIRSIPERSLDEARLRRDVVLAENLFSNLQQRYDEARLEEASTTPDVRVLDPALTPMVPARNTAPFVVLLFFLVSIGMASTGAVVLDRIDPKVRYPDQVSRDMGLTILGAVPHLKTRGGQYRLSRDEAAEVVESLRGVCLNLAHATGSNGGPMMVTVTSPGAGDGKSFLCANLALTFADAGHRTLLIDADLRRGVLHQRFRVKRRPGLTDHLRGEAAVADVIRPTPFNALSFMSCGSRTHSAPELIGAAPMQRLIEYARANYDVVIVDSPPLSGGIDSCLLGALTTNLVMVLRTGVSHRELAEAKLQMLSRFPIKLLGAVLNDVPASGSYRYYSYYLPGYAGEEEDSEKRPRELV